MKSRILVVFEMHYPYGIGGEFLSDEIRVIENIFDKIIIVTCQKPPLIITQYIPHNATVIPIREKIGKVSLFLNRVLCIFYPSVWKEVLHGVKERGFYDFKNILITVILEKSMLSFLQKNESKWINEEAYFYSYWLDTFPTYMALKKTRLKGLLISRAHGGDCFDDRGYHPYRRKYFKGLDHIFSISDAGTRDLIAQGCPPEKVSTSRLGIIKQSKKMNPYIRSDIKHIVTCSNIIHLKRLDLLIDAFSLINDIKIEWVHFGDGELKKQILEYSEKKLSKKQNIKYVFKGHVSKNILFDFYETQSVDLFINCSDTEGIPVSIMEAMSYGIPAFARDVGGNSEIIETENNGTLLPSNCDAKTLSKFIIAILDMSESKYLSLRENAFKTYDKKYNAKTNYSIFWGDILKN